MSPSLRVRENGQVISNVRLQQSPDGRQVVVTADNQLVPVERLYISLDGTSVIDQFGNVLGPDGHMRDKTNNIILDYRQRTLQNQRQFIKRLNDSDTVRHMLNGYRLSVYLMRLSRIKERIDL